jgi:hypothetical protein
MPRPASSISHGDRLSTEVKFPVIAFSHSLIGLLVTGTLTLKPDRHLAVNITPLTYGAVVR